MSVECVVSAVIAVIASIALITLLSTAHGDEVDISFQVTNPIIGESFPCDIILSEHDFENCNVDLSVSSHLGIGNYSVISGEQLGNATMNDLSLTNLSIKSRQGVGGEFVLLRLEIIPYHDGSAYIDVEFNELNDRDSDINERERITIINNNTRPEICVEANNEKFYLSNNSYEIFNLSVNNTKDNATYEWTLSKTSHQFFTGQNFTTYIDGEYLLTVTEKIGNNYSSNTATLHETNIPFGDEYFRTIMDGGFEEEKEDDEEFIGSITFYIILASIIGIIFAYVMCELFV